MKRFDLAAAWEARRYPHSTRAEPPRYFMTGHAKAAAKAKREAEDWRRCDGPEPNPFYEPQLRHTQLAEWWRAELERPEPWDA